MSDKVDRVHKMEIIIFLSCEEMQTKYSKSFYNIFIIAVPGTTRDLTNVSVNNQSVTVSWSTPNDTGGCNIENYIITVTPLNGSDPWTITTTDNSTSYIVNGLMFGQSYNFTVRANNCLGVGEESNIVTVLIPDEGMLK